MNSPAVSAVAAPARRDVGYLHLCEPDWAGGPSIDDDFRTSIREVFSRVIISAGHYDTAKAERVIDQGWSDAVAFGKRFISNPDLPHRIARRINLNPLRADLIYGGDGEGYTDAPFAHELATASES